MTLSALHALILALVGLGLLAGVFLLMRKGLLAIRYGLGWAVIAVVAIVCAPAIALLEPLASILGLTVPGLAIAVTVGFLVLVALQLSITLSGMREQVRALAEFAAVADAQAREAAQFARSDSASGGGGVIEAR